MLDFEGMNSLGFEIAWYLSLEEPELKSSSEESLPNITFSRPFLGVSRQLDLLCVASELDELGSLAGGVWIYFCFGFVN